jgi:hypothetical protein
MGSTWNLPVKSDSFLHRIEIVECSSLSYQEPCVSCYMGILLHKHSVTLDILLHVQLQAARAN